VLITLLRTIARLAILAGAGFLLFRPALSQRRFYPPFLLLVLNVMLPIYFIHRIPEGWQSTLSLGTPILLFFFFLCLVTLALQAWIGGRLVAWINGRAERAGKSPVVTRPTGFVLLFAMHNAGFLPIPILERLAPEPIVIATFFYLFAFNLAFWAIAVPIIERGRFSIREFRIKVSPSLVAMMIGFLLAITGWHTLFPDWFDRAAAFVGGIALDAILVALGGALAGIRERVTVGREQRLFLVVRLVLFPAVVLALAALPWPGPGDARFAWGMRLFFVLEAAVPPATQLMVLARSLASDEDVHYTGQLILLSYVVELVTIPVFIALSILFFAT
jgi:hypothetical protein